MKIKHFLPLFILGFLLSCRPVKDINYVQDIEKIAAESALKKVQVTLQSGDQLVITVTAKDMDVVAPFNQNYSSGKTLQNVQITGNLPNVNQTESGSTYIVDGDGFIDFPVLGRIHINGKTVDELKKELYSKVTRYIKDPTVSVKLNNFKVSVMGEVNRAGEFVLADGQGNVLQALSMAGDLTIYGLRDQVVLIRSVDGKVEQAKIDLTKSDFINSPYYNLKQGDVIYVPANKTRQKSSRLDPNAGIYISVASIIVTILASLVFRK